MIRRPAARTARRPGFTLIELLVVIVIIGVLVGLLLPVIFAAVRKANDARVAAEIQGIAAGLTQFKQKFGEYPPSRVILSETGVYSNASGAGPFGYIVSPAASDYTTPLSAITFRGNPAPVVGNDDISFGTLAERSVRAIRKYFPRAVPPITSNNVTFFHDFNGNGTMDAGFIYLEGDECLAFFLGGIPNPTSDGSNFSFGMQGFGRNPLYPFSNSGVNTSGSLPPVMMSTNREESLYEFKAAQLVDDDGDGIPGYFDPQGTGADARSYAYFVSYGSAGYDPNDCNSLEGASCDFQVGTRILPKNASYTTQTNSAAPNPYTTSLPVPITGSGVFNSLQPATYFNQNSFQILSAGGDRLFGPGGQYLTTTTTGDKVAIPPTPPFSVPQGARDVERDNVSNFAQGRLD